MSVQTHESTVILDAEPSWNIAQLFPLQGQWSEEEYLALDTNHLVEFSHGFLEVLEMPSNSHQRIIRLLVRLLERFCEIDDVGEVLFAPLRVQLWPGKYREPDVVLMLTEHSERITEQFWDGADLVIEVVSPDDPNRDHVTKRREYAQAGIPEYWIVDQRSRTITVLWLEGRVYSLHGLFSTGQQATSCLLPDFTVDVTTLFEAANKRRAK